MKHYQESGVDVEKGGDFVKKISPIIKATHSPHVLSSLAQFAAASDITFLKEYDHPVMMSATDGVGTKIHLANLYHDYRVIGIDLVAMIVNDILTTGCKTLQFLDYLACEKLSEKKMIAIVKGISQGCQIAQCALVGGETAEHPGTMIKGSFDLAGFGVGFIDKEKIIDGNSIEVGDTIIGLPSSGVHANGYSLIRKLFLTNNELPSNRQEQEMIYRCFVKEPTVIYSPILHPILESQTKTGISGMAHITGGGFNENIPRILKSDLAAQINRQDWQIPEPFSQIMKKGNISQQEMFATYNMGIGFVVICRKKNCAFLLEKITENFKLQNLSHLPPAKVIGTIIPRVTPHSIVWQ